MYGKLLHPEKALFPILVTLSGIFMLVKLLHPEKALFPILVTLSGIFILVKLLHPEKALQPIDVTPSGTSTLVNTFSHSANAIPSMLVICPDFPIPVKL